MYIRVLGTLITAATLFLAAVPTAAEENIKIAVMDLKAKTGINKMTVSSLTDFVCTTLDEIGGYDVMGRDDLQAMLEHIADKQTLDCDDTKCLAKVGGALGVSQILAGNIGMVGNRYLINMKVIDIDNAAILSRKSKQYLGDEGGLIDEIQKITLTLFQKKTAPVTETATAPDPAAEKKAAAAQEELARKAAKEKTVTEKTEQTRIAKEKKLAAKKAKAEKKKQAKLAKAGGKKIPWLWISAGAVTVAAAVVAVVLAMPEDKTDEADTQLPEPSLPSFARVAR